MSGKLENERFIVEPQEPVLEVQLGQAFKPFTPEILPSLEDTSLFLREFEIPGVGRGEVSYRRDSGFAAISFERQRIFLPSGEVSIVYRNLSNGETRIYYPFGFQLTLEDSEERRPDCLVEFLSCDCLDRRFFGRDWRPEEDLLGLYYFLPAEDNLQETEWQDWGDIFLPDNPEALADVKITFLEKSQ